jgi:hypothetical protein
MTMPEPLDIQTALEAPRPGSADLELPELAELRAAVEAEPRLARELASMQRFDAAVRKAVQQGEVPPGLENRILAALEAAHVHPSVAPERATPAGGVSRRTAWVAFAAAATVAAAATGVAVWSMLMSEDELTVSAVHDLAAEWCDALVADRWRESEAPRSFPFASDVRWRPDAWQRTSIRDVSADAVAYRLPPPRVAGVRRMTLLVLKASVPGLRPFPPKNPYKTHDRLIAAWQVGDNLYVLVLQGDDLQVLQNLYDRGVQTQFPPA